MSEVFEGYESRFSQLSADLFKKTSSVFVVDGENKKQEVIEIISELSAVEDLIQKMDAEARSLQPNVKAVLLAKVREHKSDLDNLKNEVRLIASTSLDQDARNELLEAGMADVFAPQAPENGGERTITPVENISSVEESRSVVFEGEELGVPLLQDLDQQHETRESANENMIHGVDDEMSSNDRALAWFPCRSKWTSGGIIAVLVLTFCLIMYLIFSK